MCRTYCVHLANYVAEVIRSLDWQIPKREIEGAWLTAYKWCEDGEPEVVVERLALKEPIKRCYYVTIYTDFAVIYGDVKVLKYEAHRGKPATYEYEVEIKPPAIILEKLSPGLIKLEIIDKA